MEVPPLLSLPEEAAPDEAPPLPVPEEAAPEEVGRDGLLVFGLSGSSGRRLTVPLEDVLPAALETLPGPPGTTLG